MKVFIQKLESKEYFAGKGSWVNEPEVAQAFPSGLAALYCMKEQDLQRACILYKFANARYDFSIGTEMASR